MKVINDKQQELGDAEVVQQVLNGNTATYELLMRKYNQRLFRVGISYLKDEKDVEDAMQSTYLKAFHTLGSFQQSAQFSTWLFRIMINECLHMLRKQLKFKLVDISAELPEKVVSFESGEEELIRKEMKLLLEKSILTLALKYRSVYMLREIEELSTIETSEALNISESNVKIRLHRAKEMLREELIRRAGEVEVFTFGSERCNSLVQCVLSEIMQ